MCIRTNAVSAPGRGQRGYPRGGAPRSPHESFPPHGRWLWAHCKAAGNVIIAAHVLHQVFGHSGQAVGILNVFIVIVCVQKCRVLPLADQRDSLFVQMQFIHSALLQAAQAAFAGKLGGTAAHSQWNGLRSSASLPRCRSPAGCPASCGFPAAGGSSPSRGLPRFLPEFFAAVPFFFLTKHISLPRAHPHRHQGHLTFSSCN
mgnify:CR=1 FL=1